MAEIGSRITVTGASGFLGRWLLTAARASGVDARGISRHGSRAQPASVLVQDYAETPAPRTDDEVLVHLAQSNRLDVKADQIAAVVLLERLSRLGYRCIYYASSAAVYGDKSSRPHNPDDPVTPQNDYAILKLECEKLTLATGGAVLRLTNLYGPGQSQASVMSRILSQIPGTGTLRLYTLTPVRDFCWVGDAARAALDLVAVKASGIFNVGRGKSLSIGDLARAALDAANEPNRGIEQEGPDSAFSVLSVDVSKTTKACGWVPRMELVDGLKRMILEDK